MTVAIALVAAVVAERVTRAPARPRPGGGDAVVADRGGDDAVAADVAAELVAVPFDLDALAQLAAVAAVVVVLAVASWSPSTLYRIADLSPIAAVAVVIVVAAAAVGTSARSLSWSPIAAQVADRGAGRRSRRR